MIDKTTKEILREAFKELKSRRLITNACLNCGEYLTKRYENTEFCSKECKIQYLWGKMKYK